MIKVWYKSPSLNMATGPPYCSCVCVNVSWYIQEVSLPARGKPTRLWEAAPFPETFLWPVGAMKVGAQTGGVLELP